MTLDAGRFCRPITFMKEPEGHQRRSAVHQRTITNATKIERHENLTNDVTLIKYKSAPGCYLYFGSVRGCFHVDLDFDKVRDVWPQEEIELPIRRVARVEFSN